MIYKLEIRVHWKNGTHSDYETAARRDKETWFANHVEEEYKNLTFTDINGDYIFINLDEITRIYMYGGDEEYDG